VQHWADALTKETATAADLRALTMPVLCMAGERSPRSSLAVMELLLPALPQAREVRFPALGHMAPVTQPEPVNAEIDSFLRSLVR